MPFEIKPQAITLCPEDKQYLRAAATFPPVLYNNTMSPGATIIAGSRVQTTLGGQLLLTQTLRSGIGSIKWVLGSNMIPSGAAFLDFRITSGVQYMKVVVTGTTVTVTNDVGTVIASFAHTPAAGNIFRLEVAGSTLKLYVNLLLRAFYTAVAPIKYPFFAQVSWTLSFTTPTIIIEPPVLIGDWYSDGDLLGGDWSGLASQPGGTFDDATDNGGTTYTAGVNPGVYTVLNTINYPIQEASAIITIDELTIQSESEIFVKSSEKIKLPTSYDKAQKKLVTWSVVSGGGSFTNGEFTAPATAGTSVVRATYGQQRAEVSITVRPVITPDKAAAEPGEIVNFTTNIGGSITWTADIGSPTSGGPSAGFAWTAPGISQLEAIITATNGTFTVSVTIPVLLKFPYDPHAPFNWTTHRTVLVSEAEDRTRWSRVKDADGLPYETQDLKFLGRDVAEVNAAIAFWAAHFPQKRWIFMDKVRNIRKVKYFDSDVEVEGDSTCSMDYAFKTKDG